jgi:hypothetical protein
MENHPYLEGLSPLNQFLNLIQGLASNCLRVRCRGCSREGQEGAPKMTATAMMIIFANQSGLDPGVGVWDGEIPSDENKRKNF